MLAIRLSAEHKRCKRVSLVGTVVNDQFSGPVVACSNTTGAVFGWDRNGRKETRRFKKRQ